MNIGIAITGSFCTYSKILDEIKKLVNEGNNVIPIVSKEVYSMDTRFGQAKEFIASLKEITKNDVIHTIVDAEPLGPKGLIDVLVVAPCTGNTLAKLANGLSDDAVTMSAKAHMRNYKPLVVSISSNDALGFNLQNIAKLMTAKGVYFVPFRQDAPQQKPKSMIGDLDLLGETIALAYQNKQIQPIILG